MSEATGSTSDAPSPLKQRLLDLGITEVDADAVCVYLNTTYGATDAADVITLNLTADQWETAGLKKAKANRAAGEFTVKAPEPVVAAAPAGGVMVTNVLPVPPLGADYLTTLTIGGKLRGGVTDVDCVTLARVGFADTVLSRVDSIATLLEDRINARFESLGEPNPDIFYKIRTLVTKRRHSDVFEAMGITGAGRFFTQGDKDTFRTRLRGFWHEAYGGQQQVIAWDDAFNAQGNNMLVVAQILRGGTSSLPMPDTGPVIDAARSLTEAFMKGVFAGKGLVTGRGMAAELEANFEFLDSSELLAATGIASRDDLIRELKLEVDHSAARAQETLAKWLFAMLQLPKQDDTTLATYIPQLRLLGQQIPWSKLGVGENGVGKVGRPPSSLETRAGDRTRV